MIGFLVNVFLVSVLFVFWLIYRLVKWIDHKQEIKNIPPSHKLTIDEIRSWYDYNKEESEKFYKEFTDPNNPYSYLNTLLRNY